MRIGVLSALARANDTDEILQAELALAGVSLIERQMQLCLSLGCERIICLTAGVRPALVAAKKAADKREVPFQIVHHLRSVGATITASDQVLIIADGLLAEFNKAQQPKLDHPVIFARSATDGDPQHFERLDKNRFWAGIMLLRGSIVEQLQKFPEEVDSVSTLLRLGLQEGIATRPVCENAAADAPLAAHAPLAVVRSRADARRWSERLLRQNTPPSGWGQPGYALADRMAPVVVQAGKAALASWGSAAVSILLLAASALLAPKGYVAGSYILLACAMFLLRLGWSIARIRQATIRSGIGPANPVAEWLSMHWAVILAWAGDAIFILIAWFTASAGGQVSALLGAAMLVGLLHVHRRSARGRNAPLLCDRAILPLGIGAAMLVSIIDGNNFIIVLQLLTLISLVVLLLRAPPPQLTRP